MGFITAIISFVLCVVVYVRMIRREVPEQIGKMQAWVPVGLGALAPIMSTILGAGIGLLLIVLRGGEITATGVNMPPKIGLNPFLASMLASFQTAGFAEELVKLLLALLTVKIFKPKNIYEYALAFIAVGVGFTALEEVLYSGGGFTSIGRLPGFAMHMVFGMIMGIYLGLARYEKQHGHSAGKYILLGLCLPALWHTLYDMATTFNVAFNTEDEALQSTGIVFGVIVIAVSTVLQFVLLIRFKNKAKTYSAMELK